MFCRKVYLCPGIITNCRIFSSEVIFQNNGFIYNSFYRLKSSKERNQKENNIPSLTLIDFFRHFYSFGGLLLHFKVKYALKFYIFLAILLWARLKYLQQRLEGFSWNLVQALTASTGIHCNRFSDYFPSNDIISKMYFFFQYFYTCKANEFSHQPHLHFMFSAN